MSERKVISLYEHYKNTPKKLKIVCDWDEVIQSAYPYAHYLGMLERNKESELVGIKYEQMDFSDYFNNYWHVGRSGHQIKNPSDIYHQMPFLTIAEDLLKLIKEDKIEKLIFLSASDDRKREVFNETFGKLPKEHKRTVLNEVNNQKMEAITKFADISLRLMTEEVEKNPQWMTKADWIKEKTPDFDLFIDDDPYNCKGVIENINKELAECANCDGENCPIYGSESPNHMVLAPYYPALKNQHDKRTLFVKQEVSNLKKENFR